MLTCMNIIILTLLLLLDYGCEQLLTVTQSLTEAGSRKILCPQFSSINEEFIDQNGAFLLAEYRPGYSAYSCQI